MKPAPSRRDDVDLLLGPYTSTAMHEIARTVEHIAASGLAILIAGESGTGKEWLARRIHALSGRMQMPFVPVFCSMLSPEHADREIFGAEDAPAAAGSVFTQAGGGTIYFDDIAALAGPQQMKLAAALECDGLVGLTGAYHSPLPARVIATIDAKPETLVTEGKLRKDLFYRISPIIIEMPPLRKRGEDIPLLIERLLHESNERHDCTVSGMDGQALRLCMVYDWPGNIRELRNAIDYAVLMTGTGLVGSASLPHYVTDAHRAAQTIAVHNDMNVASVEKLLIEQALNESRTKKQAAKRLGISLKTLYNKLSRYNLYDKFVNYTRGKPDGQTAPGHEHQVPAAINIAPDIPLEPDRLMRL